MVDIVRIVDIQGKATGMASVVAELNTVTAAQNKLGNASEEAGQKVTESGGATLAVANKFRALRYSLDEAWRATEKFKQAENTLKLAVEQGATSKAEAQRLTEMLTNRYNANTIAAQKNAAAIREQASAHRTLAGAQAVSGKITSRSMGGVEEVAAAPASRQFQAMSIAGAADPRGGISFRSGGGGGPEDIGRMSGQMRELGQNTRLTSFEMANLGFQINDIAVMAASGQNPFTLIMQQGMQIAQILAMSSVATMGLKASMTALGAAVVTFLANPLNQIVVGLALAAGAVALFFSSLKEGSVDAEEALKMHEALLEKIKERYGEATVAAIKYNEAASGKGLGFEAQTNVLTAEGGAATAREESISALAALQEEWMAGTEGVAGRYKEIHALVEGFIKDAENGTDSTQKWTDKFVTFGENATAHLRNVAQAVIKFIEPIERADRLLEEARRAHAVATHDTERLARSDARIFTGQAPGVAAEIKSKALTDAAAEAVRLAGALDSAERAARASAVGFDKSFETVKEAVKDAAVAAVGSMETAEQASRASAMGFDKSFEAAKKAVEAAAVELVGFQEAAERAARGSARAFEAGLEPAKKAILEAAVTLVGYQETAERAARDSATGFAASLEKTKEAIKDANVSMVGSMETAEQAARASATGFEEAFERVKKAVQDAAVELVGFMETAERAGRASARGFEAGLEDLLKKRADEAEKAADEEARRRKQEADAAAREAERKAELIEQLRFEHEIMDMLEEDQQVAINLRNLGADATARQKGEVEALTRSMEQYKQAVEDAKEADKKAMKAWEDARDAAIEKMDEFRDSAKGILSAFIEGGPKGALEALGSRLAQLGEDLVIEGLFGKQGQVGGGIFGDAIQNLLGPIGEKPVATALMNVTASVVNIGGGMAGVPTGAGGVGWTSPVSTGTAGEVIQAQSDAGIRTLPISAELESVLKQASAATGLIPIVESGGQAALGSGGPRTGSTRHDLGMAADLDLRDPVTGQLLNMNNPADVVRMEAFLRESRAAGATGIGAGPGYMGGSTRMHVGFGDPGYWGAYGVGSQAPPWVQRAYDQGSAMPGASEPLTTAATTATPAVDELATSISGLNNPISTAVPALQNLANTILNFSPGGIPISAQAASAITSGFGGFFQHGGTLGAGNWGVAGEHGPEIIHGPASITPMQRGTASKFNVNIKTQEGVTARVTNAQQNEEGDFDLEIFAEAIERRVRDRYGLRQQVSRWGRA